MSSSLSSSPAFTNLIKYIGGAGVSVNAGLLSGMFIFLPLFLMAFGVTQVNRWSADEQDGRLDLVLPAHQPRLGLLLSRFAALAPATVLCAGVRPLVSFAPAAAAGGSL